MTFLRPTNRRFRLGALIIGLLASLCLPSAWSATITLYWSGTITDLFEFSEGATPAGLSNGTPISGALVFESTQFSSHGDILGSHSSGDVYRYGTTLTLNLQAGGQEWSVAGSNVSLINYSYEPLQAFDAFSTSERNSFAMFPGYVGSFEVGFALFAQDSPFAIFDTTEIENATFDFDHPTSANGFLSSRLFDENDDIVDGYYFDFAITRTSASPIPEPSVNLMGLTAAAIFMGRRRPRK